MSKVIYRKGGGRRRVGFPLLVLCAVLLFGFSAVNMLWPKREQLELENRKAAQFPAFSVSALLDGSWQSGFSRWMQDQFSFRDAAVNTQRAADEILFRKAEEGGILLGKDRWMFTKLFTVDDATEKQLNKNIAAVSEFAANHPGKVTFLLAPSASVIYPEKLPAGAPMRSLPRSARAQESSTCANCLQRARTSICISRQTTTGRPTVPTARMRRSVHRRG